MSAPSRRWIGLALAALGSLRACSLFAPSDAELLGGNPASSGGRRATTGGVDGEGAAGAESAAGAAAGSPSAAGGAGGAGGAPSSAGASGEGAEAGRGGGAGAGGACSGDACDCGPDRHHCGADCMRNDSVESCGAGCSPCKEPKDGHATCDGRACGIACDVGFTPCGGTCIDQRTDSHNCGGCGAKFACSGDSICQAGRCVSVSGCSDGTREGFSVAGAYLAIAGCAARWQANSMRAPKTGGTCGQELGECTVPADACGAGWHVCAAPPYGPAEVRARATVAECLAQPGAYAAAVGDQECEPCSEEGAGAACCGQGCVQQNGSCIYPEMTAWFGVIQDHMNRCGDIESSSATRGVLCCLDP